MTQYYNTSKFLKQIFVTKKNLIKLQSTLVISTLLTSNNRLSRSENLIPILTWKSNDR